MLVEVNIDGLVGPTHHFGGLGVGNVASREHHHKVSHPRTAAMEGLRKALLIDLLGIPQFILPPPPRPQLELLTRLGFGNIGNDGGPMKSQSLQAILDRAKVESPRGLSAAFSSAFMWVANAATVTPACDSTDGRAHCTSANLISSWHRASEASERAEQMKEWTQQLTTLEIHAPLPSIIPLRDEGAANHMRLCDSTGMLGINLFVHGDYDGNTSAPSKHYARHTREASQAIARQHRLAHENTFFLHQHPIAIDAGVFHNDVIATSCGNLLLHHEMAFWNANRDLELIERRYHELTGSTLMRLCISQEELPLQDAVRSYFFNSQIVRKPESKPTDPRYALICPHHCQVVQTAKRLIERLIEDRTIPIEEVHFIQLEESMANGGGPACLRLRMMLPEAEAKQLDSRFRINSQLVDRLMPVIEMYPIELHPIDDFNADFVEHLLEIDQAFRHLFSL